MNRRHEFAKAALIGFLSGERGPCDQRLTQTALELESIVVWGSVAPLIKTTLDGALDQGPHLDLSMKRTRLP